MIAIWIVVGLIGFFVVFLAVMYALGSRLPVEHVTTARATLRAPQHAVWEALADVPGQMKWYPVITKIERIADRDGKPVWREEMGRNSFDMAEAVTEPPRRIVREIVDNHGPFTGKWEFVLEPAIPGPGTTVRITETGRVHSAIPRAFIHYLFGTKYYLKKYLNALAAKFGETTAVTD